MALIALCVGGFYYFGSDSGQMPSVAERPPLASTALDAAKELGTFIRESVSRDVSTLAAMLRRSSDSDDDGGKDTDADGEVETIVLPSPRRLTGAQRMARLEHMAPTLSNEVGRLDWAAVPVEPPLFRVFDETDTDVVPPGTKDIRLRDDLLASWAADFKGAEGQGLKAEFEAGTSEQIGMVEVIISEHGQVEKARLISSPGNVHESMLLSAVKAWQFTPAIWHEQAVRYRQVMPIVVAR